MTEIISSLPSSIETVKLKVMHLKIYWSKVMAGKSGKLPDNAFEEEWMTDVTLLSTLGLGLEQTLKYVFNESTDFSEFEDWIVFVNNEALSRERIAHFNAEIEGRKEIVGDNPAKVLSAADVAFWEENGYIILRGAIPGADCDNTVELICEHLGIKRYDPAAWYKTHKDRQGIMVQLFQHPQLQKNRDTKIIRRAYEQLWRRTDILVNTDRVGFNPPETECYKFPGPKLHWDVSLAQSIPFGTQGILYLSDTAANQGAFTLVPGFQHRVEGWMQGLPKGADPRTQDIHALGALPIAANAGDFIIWHQALPHGSSPNTADKPRFVQYINYQPIDPGIKTEWI